MDVFSTYAASSDTFVSAVAGKRTGQLVRVSLPKIVLSGSFPRGERRKNGARRARYERRRIPRSATKCTLHGDATSRSERGKKKGDTRSRSPMHLPHRSHSGRRRARRAAPTGRGRSVARVQHEAAGSVAAARGGAVVGDQWRGVGRDHVARDRVVTCTRPTERARPARPRGTRTDERRGERANTRETG